LILILVVETLVFALVKKSSKEKIARTQTKTQQMTKEMQAANKKIKVLDEETARCKEILIQRKGEFADYDYCKQFLQTFSF